MESFDLVSKSIDYIGKDSQIIISNVDDLKVSLIGFLSNRDHKDAYKDAYWYLNLMLKSISIIEENAIKINLISKNVKESYQKK